MVFSSQCIRSSFLKTKFKCISRTWGNGSILKEEGWERPQQEDERDRKITSSDRKRDGEGTDRWKSQLVMNKKKRK